MSQPTVRDLRRRWKPRKLALNHMESQHPTNIRFHRACSWLERAEEIHSMDDLDLAILSQWVAFNSLYGQWDEKSREPAADKACWRAFVDRMLEFDESDFIADALVESKPLVISILNDEHLSQYFWKEPTERRARQSKKARYDARSWYLDGDWTMLLDRLIERIYLLRCQLVHGAATFNSSLNRTAIQHCSMMLDRLLRAFLLVWIDHGAAEDWGAMCYPPMRSRNETKMQSLTDRAPGNESKAGFGVPWE